MAVKKIKSLNKHENVSTNTNAFDIENYLNANWDTLEETVNNNADELEQSQKDIENIKTEQTTQNTNIQELQADNTTNKEDIKNIKAKNTEQDTSIQNNTEDIEVLQAENEELKAENERLRADNNALAIIGQASGENITLNDSSDARFTKFEIGGNHKQETREGYNIVDISKFTDTTREGVAITRDIKKGCLTLNGTSTSTFAISIPLALTAGTIISYSLNNSQTNAEIAIRFGTANSTIGYLACGSVNTKKENLTLTENITDLQIRIGAGVTLTNFVIYPQVEKSDSLHEFELYGAMPSFEFKSEVETIKDKADFVVCNKNFLNIQPFTLVGGTTQYKNKEVIINNMKKGTYVFQRKFEKSSNAVSTAGTVQFFKNGVYYKNINQAEDKTQIVLEEDCVFRMLFLLSGSSVSETESSVRFYDIQLEEGTTATEVVDHQEQAFTVDIQKEFCKIGDYKDTFVKIASKWYEKHVIDKIVLNGSQISNVGGTNFETMYANGNIARTIPVEKLLISNIRDDIISNCLPTKTKSLWNAIESGIQTHANYANIQVSIPVENIENEFGTTLTASNYITAFNQYLSNHNVTAYIVLATPKLIPCTAEQSAILDEIEKTIHSYKGTTHIFSTNELSPIFNTEYAKDTQAYIDNQINTVANAVLELEGNINV